MTRTATHFIIINPNSGKRRGKRDWPEIASLLEKQGISFEFIFTAKRLDALIFAKQAAENGFRNIIVTGGDGTLNEAVNGIMLQRSVPSHEISIAMIPVGTGNDWGRMYQCPSDYKECVKMIAQGHTVLQDAGKVQFVLAGEIQERYFMNVAGIGCDAVVVRDTNSRKDRGSSGRIAYMLSLARSIFKFSSQKAVVAADGNTVFNGALYSANFGICRYSGGGMMQVPKAIPDDGLFDITIIGDVGKLKIVRNTARLYDGSFTAMKEVSTFRCAAATVHSNDGLLLEADGEMLGTAPIEFSILPRALRFVIPEKIKEK